MLLHDDYSPPTGVYYFRQGAFSQFNGRRLIATTRDGLDTDVLDGFPVDQLNVPEMMVTIMVFYLTLVSLMVFAIRSLERHLRLPGYSAGR